MEVFYGQKLPSFPCVHTQRKEKSQRSAAVVALTLQRIWGGIHAAGGEGCRQVAGAAEEVAEDLDAVCNVDGTIVCDALHGLNRQPAYVIVIRKVLRLWVL